MLAQAVERHAAVVPHDMVFVSERGGAVVACERLRELPGVAVGVPAEELRLAAGQILRRRDRCEVENEGEDHRGRLRVGAILKVRRWGSCMRAFANRVGAFK